MTQSHKKDQPQDQHTTTAGDPRAAKDAKLKALIEAGLEPYPHIYDRTDMANALQTKYKDLENGAETQDTVSVAGRIMAMRNNGMFIDLMDTSGRVQIFSHADSMSEDMLKTLSFFDLGDIIGVKGTIRRTPRGELSVRATELHMLSKSLQPLPDKHHGLTDVEQRYRQRYVDLIMNEDSRETLLMRSKILRFMREYLNQSGAIEVETPMLQPIMGGASAKPFVTHHNALSADFYMKVAAELYLKRLLVGGMTEHVYEIGRYFRNEGISIKHNPEFSGAEGNMLYADYYDMMDLIENLCCALVVHIHGNPKIMCHEQEIDFSTPWKRRSMCDLIQDETGVDFLAIKTSEEALETAQKLGVKVDPKSNWGQIVAEVFDDKVEHTLIQPTHVTDHPLDISPLSKVHRDNPRLVERFETFINGWEIANAFSELNDPAIQRARFEEQVAQRDSGDEEAQMMDDDYITALEYGLPPNAGWGIGIDRLVMILTDSHNIRDVICFPTLRPNFAKQTSSASPSKSLEPVSETPSHDKDRYLNVDDSEYRFVVVVNGKEENKGKLMNAIGHSMVGLAGEEAKDHDFCLIDYEDGEGNMYPSVSHYPVIILKAKNGNQIRKIRAQAIEKNLPFTNFTKDMQLGSSKEQIASLKTKKEDDVEYLVLSLFGKTSELKELTGKLSLYS